MLTQQQIVEQLVHKARVVIVQPLGWGKRDIYLQATQQLRDQDEGVTVVISRVAVQTATSACIDAVTNQTFAERAQLIEACNTKQCDTLYISPEQLADDSLFAVLSQLRIALLVIEEAHHLSQLGAMSDPHYLRIAKLLNVLPENIRVLATTATANRRVTEDIAKKIGASVCSKGPVSLGSVHLHKVLLPTTEARYAWLWQNRQTLQRPSLIYAATVRECERLSEWLNEAGCETLVYHTGLSLRERTKRETAFTEGRVQTLICTTATTTFFNKEDIHTIIHYDRPLSIVTYYQQLTNAGRGIQAALAVILYDNALKPHVPNPATQQANYQAVIDCIAQHDGITLTQLKARLNQTDHQLTAHLQHALIDGLIEKERTVYYRTPKPFLLQQAYTRHVEEARQLEYNGLSYLLQVPTCLMQTMAAALDDTTAAPCGKCSYCTQLAPTEDRIRPQASDAVTKFFEARAVTFTPHKKSAIYGRALRHRLSASLALGSSDEPRGRQMMQEYKAQAFSETTLHRAASALQPLCTENTVITALSTGQTFAKMLAKRLALPYIEAFAPLPVTTETRLNDVQQETYAREAITCYDVDVADKHVIIVTAVTRSGWTLAIAADYLGAKQTTGFALIDEKEEVRDDLDTK